MGEASERPLLSKAAEDGTIGGSYLQIMKNMVYVLKSYS